MKNLFNDFQIPEIEPTSIISGDLIRWRLKLTVIYPPSDYKIEYSLRKQSAISSEISIDSTVDKEYYNVVLLPKTTATFSVGAYVLHRFIFRKRDSARIQDKTSKIEILPDPQVSNSDSRSHALVMINKIESLLEGRADTDIDSYTINNREINKMSPKELLEWRNYYRQENAFSARKRKKIFVRMP